MKRVFTVFLYSFLVMSIIAAIEANAGPRDSNRSSSYSQLRELAGEMADTGSGFLLNSGSELIPQQRPPYRMNPPVKHDRPTALIPDLMSAPRNPQKGKASHYWRPQPVACPGFKRFNPNEMTAAHKTLPCGSRVRVYNPATKKSVVVLITDRGPFVEGRIIDLSTASFSAIGNTKSGVIGIQLEVVPKTTALGPVKSTASAGM